MIYQLSRGNRVTWCHDFTSVKAQITRVWKNQAEILTVDFEKFKVPLDELELVPVVVRVQKSALEQNCTLTDPEVVREQKSCTLTNELHPNRWIEEKMIKRSGKLHGPYRYARWRDANGKMKSKYLGKSDVEH